MQGGDIDVEGLNPRRLIECLKRYYGDYEKGLREAFLRRAISAVFFAIFNYWAAIRYASGDRGWRALGSHGMGPARA